MPESRRPRIALVITTWYEASHADVLATGLIKGYDWGDQLIEPRVEVVSAYMEQRGISAKGRNKPDIGVDILTEAGIPMYDTPAEALGAGHPGVNVDGVLIIGEHGDYEDNEWGQKLYPRRRLFDSVLSAMIATDTFVPVFNDKHLAWNWTDAKAMYDNARRLGVPFMAGSTVPIAWRRPVGTEWPMDAPMTAIVGAGYGGFEVYGYHGLEGILSFTERRAGGESGVVEVRGYDGDRVGEGLSQLDPALVRAAVAAHPVDEADIDSVIEKTDQVITFTHRDGLVSGLLLSSGLQSFSVAAKGPDHEVSAELLLQGAPHSHFLFLGRGAETLFLTGEPPYPVERTLLAGGIIDHAVRNARGAFDEKAEHLDVAWTVPEHIPGTGIHLEPFRHADS
ncbi:MAG TPA: hypothetical protein IAA98_09550 [Candidatus Avipropionibacterium avicola]|uniref:Uncharacterized protein n=1 Tax=Candidatus Avipropionibacterium avicola TaxID=2840701 RepID=A0A9D1GXX1_9ACTN|nr:hypothetical protein [Candidatus Avipropionibacterium avicola]